MENRKKYHRVVGLEKLAELAPEAHAEWLRCESMNPLAGLCAKRGWKIPSEEPRFGQPVEGAGWVLVGEWGRLFILGYNPGPAAHGAVGWTFMEYAVGWTFMEYATADEVSRIYGGETQAETEWVE